MATLFSFLPGPFSTFCGHLAAPQSPLVSVPLVAGCRQLPQSPQMYMYYNKQTTSPDRAHREKPSPTPRGVWGRWLFYAASPGRCTAAVRRCYLFWAKFRSRPECVARTRWLCVPCVPFSALGNARPGLVFRFFTVLLLGRWNERAEKTASTRPHTRKDAAQSRCCRAEYFGRRCCCRRATEGTGASLGTGRGGTGWKRSCGGGGGGGRRRGGS